MVLVQVLESVTFFFEVHLKDLAGGCNGPPCAALSAHSSNVSYVVSPGGANDMMKGYGICERLPYLRYLSPQLRSIIIKTGIGESCSCEKMKSAKV